ncbi:MAG TPA: sigma-70 family RNA polymerase sigma factor [Anaerolineales bacterium]|nr:sigma-70 family RNA polymerase sigma factor [Anaerolineales bacterium]
MFWTADTLRPFLERALQEWAETKDKAVGEAVTYVIWMNLSRGRIENFLNGQATLTPQEYVLRVVATYEKLHPYLVELQEEHSSHAWQTLYTLMCKTAMKFLLRHGFSVSQATRDLAEECASEAATRILTAHFPYDVEFFPWMYVLLRNVCYTKIKTSLKTVAQDISELEEWLADSTILTGRKIEKAMDVRKRIRQSVDKLSPGRKEVIQLHYFDGFSFQEIAEKMSKTVNAVHQLHFYAIRELEKLLRHS